MTAPNKVCEVCGTPVYRRPSSPLKRVFCSFACVSIGKATTLEYFTQQYICDLTTGCHVWIGSVDRLGYGKVGPEVAHRWHWLKINGSIPKGLELMHSCDNPPCVNLDHLSLGTHAHAQNMRGSKERGRARNRIREDHNLAKLTWEQVREIRERLARGEIATELAREFKVSSTNVYNIKKKKIWQELVTRTS